MRAHYLDLIWYRAISDLKSEANRAFLGVLWWVLEPALYLAVFYLVFDLGLRQGGDGYVSFLLVGLVVWKWLDSSVRSASNSINGAVGLINQVYLPKLVFPSIVVVTNTIKFFITLVILLLLIVWLDEDVSAVWLWLPVLCGLQFLLVWGASCIAAAVVPFIPDLRYVVNYGMTMTFFMSGIFYDISSMTENVQALLQLNPAVWLITMYRSVLLEQQSPQLEYLLRTAIVALSLAFVGWKVLRVFDQRYPRVI